MSINPIEVYDKIVESGVVDSPAAKAYICNAVEMLAGKALTVDGFFLHLHSKHEWSPEALSRIEDVISDLEGQCVSVNIYSAKSIEDQLCQYILFVTERWGLTFDEKQAIVQDEQLMRRWVGEYDPSKGFSYLLDYVVDDEIAEWCSERAHTPLADRINSAHTFVVNHQHETDNTVGSKTSDKER